MQVLPPSSSGVASGRQATNKLPSAKTVLSTDEFKRIEDAVVKYQKAACSKRCLGEVLVALGLNSDALCTEVAKKFKDVMTTHIAKVRAGESVSVSARTFQSLERDITKRQFLCNEVVPRLLWNDPLVVSEKLKDLFSSGEGKQIAEELGVVSRDGEMANLFGFVAEAFSSYAVPKLTNKKILEHQLTGEEKVVAKLGWASKWLMSLPDHIDRVSESKSQVEVAKVAVWSPDDLKSLEEKKKACSDNAVIVRKEKFNAANEMCEQVICDSVKESHFAMNEYANVYLRKTTGIIDCLVSLQKRLGKQVITMNGPKILTDEIVEKLSHTNSERIIKARFSNIDAISKEIGIEVARLVTVLDARPGDKEGKKLLEDIVIRKEEANAALNCRLESEALFRTTFNESVVKKLNSLWSETEEKVPNGINASIQISQFRRLAEASMRMALNQSLEMGEGISSEVKKINGEIVEAKKSNRELIDEMAGLRRGLRAKIVVVGGASVLASYVLGYSAVIAKGMYQAAWAEKVLDFGYRFFDSPMNAGAVVAGALVGTGWLIYGAFRAVKAGGLNGKNWLTGSAPYGKYRLDGSKPFLLKRLLPLDEYRYPSLIRKRIEIEEKDKEIKAKQERKDEKENDLATLAFRNERLSGRQRVMTDLLDQMVVYGKHLDEEQPKAKAEQKSIDRQIIEMHKSKPNLDAKVKEAEEAYELDIGYYRISHSKARQDLVNMVDEGTVKAMERMAGVGGAPIVT